MLRKLLTVSGAALATGLVVAAAAVAVFTNHSYVTTPSMYPTIPPGSMIFVSPQEHYRIGEVIEFHANGLTWAHRLIAVKADGDLVTKGDNPRNSPDVFVPPLTRKDVVGAVVLAPRWLGFPELIAHDPGYGLAWLRAELGLPGRLALVVLAGLLPFASLPVRWATRRRGPGRLRAGGEPPEPRSGRGARRSRAWRRRGTDECQPSWE